MVPPSQIAQAQRARRFPVGVELFPDAADVRVWAPAATRVHLALVTDAANPAAHVSRTIPLDAEERGYFSGIIPAARHGDLYMLRLDDGPLRPDPCSRFQPAGPHGPSMIVDHGQYAWRTAEWPAPGSRADVVYELHLGSFSPEGTWRGAAARLPRLAAIGITIVEVMPVAEFTGRYGWGYDGVALFAPFHGYGSPDDMRAFVDEAHRLGLAVVLDVVYNHCGPDGCYLSEFAPGYFSTRYKGEWGDPLNFDDRGSDGVREFVRANARYWISEFRLDGLRLDATQAILDASPSHIIRELIAEARGATSRQLWFVAENEPQQSTLVRSPEERGFDGDALWNDDFHHSAVVAATGRRDAYYSDYEGAPQEFVSAAKYGYLYQGQYYGWQQKARGSYALDVPARAFVCFLENHDQVANSLRGRRLHQLTSPGRYRALSALLLLGPWVPMLFQGQEWGSPAPFHYFADMPMALREGVASGRRDFLSQFGGCAAFPGSIADPCAPETFEQSRLPEPQESDHSRLYRDLLRWRHSDAVIGSPRRVDGAVLSPQAFVLRFFASEPASERLLVVNLGVTMRKSTVPEPLLAPPPGLQWARVWDSEQAAYGGNGMNDCDLVNGLWISGECAILFAGAPQPEGRVSRHHQ